MKIRQFSDLHNEFSIFMVPELPDDHETTLVIPGDIDIVKAKARYGAYLKYLSERFKYVVFTAGNHEYWTRSILKTTEYIHRIIAKHELTNVFYLQDDSVVLDGVAFIGATLWTEITNPITELQVHGTMNDYRKIRHGTPDRPWAWKLRVSDTTALHRKSRAYIEKEAKKQREAGNTVVVLTHHAPSFMSVCPKHVDDNCNPAYMTSLEELLLNGTIDNWMHGHIHWAHDYVIGHCRVTCNPRGYYSPRYGGELINFNPTLVLEV